MARRHWPTCGSCHGPITDAKLAEGTDDEGNRVTFHVGHVPRSNPEPKGKKNIFFRHRLRERRQRKLIEKATELEAQRAGLTAARGLQAAQANPTYFFASPARPVYMTERAASERWRAMTKEQQAYWLESIGEDRSHAGKRFEGLPANVRGQLMKSHKNPHYPPVKGKQFERRWESVVQAVKRSGSKANAFAVATATLGGYPAGRARARENPFRSRVASAKARVSGFGAKHPKGVRAAKAVGKGALAAGTVVAPEFGLPASAAVAGVRAARSRRNPTPPRGVYITEQLDRAQKYLTAGRESEALKYVERAKRMASASAGDADENAAFLSRARTIEDQIRMVPPPSDEGQSKRNERIARGLAERMPSLELPSTPPDPPDEFWGMLGEEAKRQFPGRDLANVIDKLQHLYHYGIDNRAKWAVLGEWNKTHSLGAINDAFWRVFEAYLNGEFEERGGRLVFVGKKGEGIAHKNPSFKDQNPPVVEGAEALSLKYVDRNGNVWIHSFREDSRKTRLHVQKGILSDKVVLSPTSVGPAGIGDDGGGR